MQDKNYISLSKASSFLGYSDKKYLQKLAEAGKLPMTDTNEKGQYVIHKLAVCALFLMEYAREGMPKPGRKRGIKMAKTEKNN